MVLPGVRVDETSSPLLRHFLAPRCLAPAVGRTSGPRARIPLEKPDKAADEPALPRSLKAATGNDHYRIAAALLHAGEAGIATGLIDSMQGNFKSKSTL